MSDTELIAYDQSEFDLRFDWGECGLKALLPGCDVIVIVDILSFSTAVCVAVSRGATVFPYRWKDDSRIEYAESVNAVLAGPRGVGEYSLSPLSLQQLHDSARIVLPSPNGATLSLATGDKPTFTGCLRNAAAIAKAAQNYGNKIAVIACGERWSGDGSLRFAFEDMLGAGSILSQLPGSLSPEAEAAVSVFQAAKPDLVNNLKQCASGKELIARGYEKDIDFAAEFNVDVTAAELMNRAYTASN